MVKCMRMVGLIVFDYGCEAFQPFLSRSRGDFGRFWSILARFSRFPGMGDLLNTLHVPSGGVREALGMHLGRPGPWVGQGKGISLKISRAPRHTPIVGLQ